jgi:RNA polymerase sigma-70 factor (ECF subfamily)
VATGTSKLRGKDVPMSGREEEWIRPALRLVRVGEASQPDDSELLVLHLEGDRDAFASLVRRYERPVYRLAMRYARNADEAEELVQRTFLRALGHAAKIGPGPSFQAFLFRAAANLCKNHLRDRARLVFGLPLEVAAPEGEGPEKKQRRRRVREALLRLPLRQRQVVSLRVDAELPFAQVASSLGITENNAKVCYHLAVRRLRALLGGEDL